MFGLCYLGYILDFSFLATVLIGLLLRSGSTFGFGLSFLGLKTSTISGLSALLFGTLGAVLWLEIGWVTGD